MRLSKCVREGLMSHEARGVRLGGANCGEGQAKSGGQVSPRQKDSEGWSSRFANRELQPIDKKSPTIEADAPNHLKQQSCLFCFLVVMGEGSSIIDTCQIKQKKKFSANTPIVCDPRAILRSTPLL